MQNMVRHYLLPILAGILIGTSYIPFPPWALLFCITPLWIFWWKEKSAKKVFWGGWITQFVLNLIGFHWIAHTVVEFGQMPLVAGLAVLLLFCCVAHLYYPIAGVIWFCLKKKFNLSQQASFFILPLVFILCERLYPFLFYWHFGYPWLWAKLPGYQLGDIIGFFGLNLITLFVNSFFALFYLQRKPGQWLHKYSVLALGLFLVVNILGYVHGLNLKPTDKTLRVLAVQGNIGNSDKIYAEEGVRFQRKIVDIYLDLTRKGLEESDSVDLVVWPETAFPEVIYDRGYGVERSRVARLSQEFNVQILTGAYQKIGKKRRVHNGLVLLDGRQILGAYQKTVLLAFGEYFPFSNYIPQLKTLFPMVSDFGRGPGPSIIEWDKAKIGAQICYEGLFDEFSAGLQKKGAQFFVNVTNDSWFGYPFEPYQHMYMTLARAVENRRPLLRVTNTGITTAILSDGQVLEHSPHNQIWYKTYEIPFHSTPQQTFYVKLVDIWPYLLLLMIGLIILGDRIARTGKHRLG